MNADVLNSTILLIWGALKFFSNDWVKKCNERLDFIQEICIDLFASIGLKKCRFIYRALTGAIHGPRLNQSFLCLSRKCKANRVDQVGSIYPPEILWIQGNHFLYRMTFWRILDFHSFEILVKFLKPLCLSSASVRSSSCSGICSVRSFLHFGLSNAALPRVYYVISVQSLTSRDDVILALWESLRALVGFTFPVEFIKQAARE